MDELEVLRAACPDPAPADIVVDRHRSALWEAMLSGSAAGGAVGLGDAEAAPALGLHVHPARRRTPHIRFAVAAAAIAVVGVAAAIVTRDHDTTPLATEAPPATVAPMTSERCGALPFTPPLPSGFATRVDAPSPDGPSEVEPHQLVAHWASPTGSVEVRWPSGTGRFGSVDDQRRGSEEPAAASSWSIAGDPRPVASGRQAVAMEVHDPGLSDDVICQSMVFTVADDDPARARAVGSELFTLLTAQGGPFGGPEVALVTGSSEAAAPPEVPPCNAPPGVDHVDRVGGPVSIGTHRSAEAALAAFIESSAVEEVDSFGLPTRRATVADGDYVATHLPDGSIAFVHREGLGVTVVHAATTEDGWTIDRWEATGC